MLSSASAVLGAISAPSEKPDLPGHNLGPIALPRAILRLVLTGRPPSLDIDLAAFAEILAAEVGQLPEDHDAVPFGTFLLCAAAVLETLGRASENSPRYRQRAESESAGRRRDSRLPLPC
jgi:hypothetical protein